MPRELIHWIVLDRAIRKVREKTIHSDSQQAFTGLDFSAGHNHAAAKLGAVAHDAPYFLNFGKHQFRSMADLIHGTTGEDTYKPMTHIASAISSTPETKRAVLNAFLAGMLSHIATDITFHPMIFYFTGNYHDKDPVKQNKAQALHRKLETYLESWARGKEEVEPTVTCRTIRKELGSDFSTICTTLESSLPTPVEIAESRLWERSFAAMVNAHDMFRSLSLGFLVRGINSFCPEKFEALDALFRFGRSGSIQFFEESISYRNPITNEQFRFTCDELLDQSVEKCLSLWELFESKSGANGEVGASLNFGIPSAPPEQALYFTDSGLDFLK